MKKSAIIIIVSCDKVYAWDYPTAISNAKRAIKDYFGTKFIGEESEDNPVIGVNLEVEENDIKEICKQLPDWIHLCAFVGENNLEKIKENIIEL